jgi:membrane-associated protease RseP (regulator of RpoE activity)
MLRKTSFRWTLAASALLTVSSFSTTSQAADPPPNKVPDAPPVPPAEIRKIEVRSPGELHTIEVRTPAQIFVIDDGRNFAVPAPPPVAVGPAGIVRTLIGARTPANVIPNKYIVGVALGEVPAYVWKQLKREGQSGVVVMQVLPDTPAQAAGIQENDILLKANDVALAGQNDLSEVVREDGEKEVQLLLLRNGDELTVSVTPRVKAPKVVDANEVDVKNFIADVAGSPSGEGRFEVVNFGPAMMVRSDQKVTDLKAEVEALRQQVEALQKAVDALNSK